MRSKATSILALLGALAAAIALMLARVSPAAPQAQLISVYTAEPLPLTDPFSPLWQQAPALDVPLTPQQTAVPMLAAASVPSVRVRSLNDGQWIAFLLEWEDKTPDTHATAPDQFADAAALLFPVGQDTLVICMGAAGQLSNIWHWKASWQQDIDKGFQDLQATYPNFFKDYYPFVVGNPPYKMPTDFASRDARAYLVGWSVGNPLSQPLRLTPVEDLMAEGFGTLTTQRSQDVLGRGVWQDGRWRVVFARPLVTADTADAHFLPGKERQVAFAVWNGSNKEVGAKKQLSGPVGMLVATPPTAPPPPPAPTPAAERPVPQAPAPTGIGGGELLLFVLGAVVLTAVVVGSLTFWVSTRRRG